MPLKGIPFILSPDLLHALCSAGHGDEIVLADAHFPTSSVCRCGPKEIRADGHGIPALLDAILKVFPLDSYVACPVAVMKQVDCDVIHGRPAVWSSYQKIVDAALAADSQTGHVAQETQFEEVERFAFYERAKKAFAVVHTGETAQYGNIIIKKGIVLS